MASYIDPTNANAVPGSSKHPYDPSPTPSSSQVGRSYPEGAARRGPGAPPTPPSLPTGDPVQSSNGTPAPPSIGIVSNQAQPPSHPPRRRADGPVIVPTVIGSDGVREVPQLFEHCQVEDLITLIASMLDRLIEHNDRILLTPNSLTRFHSRAPPSIGVRDYLLRIAKYTNVEPCCLLILLPYVDKVCARMNTFTISSLTVHRFIIAAISVGSKALSDAFCTNGRYSRVGGVSVIEMNLLEKEFCEAIDWRLTTSGSVLAHYYTSLVRSHPRYRLSTAPLPESDSPLEPPSSVLTRSAQPEEEHKVAENVTHSASRTPSAANSPSGSSSSRSISNSASSSSMSIDPSPALSTTSLPRSDHPPPPRPSSMTANSSDSSSLASSSPHLRKLQQQPQVPHHKPVTRPLSLSADVEMTATSTPPLIPPNLSRRIVTASNLPSPNMAGPTTVTTPANRSPSYRLASPSPPRTSEPHSHCLHSKSNRTENGVATEQNGTNFERQVHPPVTMKTTTTGPPITYSPAKRGRTSSPCENGIEGFVDHSNINTETGSGSGLVGELRGGTGRGRGGGGGGGGGRNTQMEIENPNIRFRPSPRLSGQD